MKASMNFYAFFFGTFYFCVWWARAWKVNNYSPYVTYFTRNISSLILCWEFFLFYWANQESKIKRVELICSLSKVMAVFCSLSSSFLAHIDEFILASFHDPTVSFFRLFTNLRYKQIDPMIWTTWGERISMKNYHHSMEIVLQQFLKPNKIMRSSFYMC